MAEVPQGFKLVEQPIPEGFRTAQGTLAGEVGPQLKAPGQPALQGITSSLGRGLTFGLDPFVSAAGRAVGGAAADVVTGADDTDFFDRFNRELETVRAEGEAFREERPGLSLAGEITGAVVGPGGFIKGAKTLPGKIAASATEGAAFGGGFAAGAGEDIEEGIELGAAFGVASPFLAGAVQRIPGSIASFARGAKVLANSPTLQQLRTKTATLYRQASESGVVFGGFDEFATKLRTDILGQGARPKLTDKAIAVLDEIDRFKGNPVDFEQLDGLRRVAQIAASATEPAEKRLGVMIIEAIDDFALQGDEAVSGIAKRARNLWGRVRRDELIGQAIEKARLNASGTEQGLRVEFRKILTNAKKLRGFTKPEQDAMRRIVKGTSAGNTLRAIGKLGFNPRATTSNVVGGAVGTGAGGVVGGVPGALAVQGAASGSRLLSERLANRNARVLSAMIRTGTPETQLTGIARRLEQIGDDPGAFQALVRSLNIGGLNAAN